jgi:hypothetical protein
MNGCWLLVVGYWLLVLLVGCAKNRQSITHVILTVSDL